MSTMRAIGGSQRAVERDRIGNGQTGGANPPTGGAGFPAILGAAASASDAPSTPGTAETLPSGGGQLQEHVRTSHRQSKGDPDGATADTRDPTRTPPAASTLDPSAVIGDQAAQAQPAALAAGDLTGSDAAPLTKPGNSSGERAPPVRHARNGAMRDGAAASVADLAQTPLFSAPNSGDITTADGSAADSRPMPDGADPLHPAPLSSLPKHGDGGNDSSVLIAGQENRHRPAAHPINDPETASGVNNPVAASIAPPLQGTDSAPRSPAGENLSSPVTTAPVVGDPHPRGAISGSTPEATRSGDPEPYPASISSGVSDQTADLADLSSGRVMVHPAVAEEVSGQGESNPTSAIETPPSVRVTLPEPNVDLISETSRSNPRVGDVQHSIFSPAGTTDPSSTPASSSLSANPQGGPSTDLTAPPVPLADLADRLSYHMTRLADSDGHEVVLRLHPPELGDLTVRVLVSGRDVSAWFASPHAQVQQTISAAINQLHTDLGNAGYSLNGAWVGAEAGGSGDRERSPTTRQQQRAAANPASIEGSPDLPNLAASSRVSVYV